MTAFPKSILTILTLTKMTTDCKMIKSHFFGEEIGAKIPTFFSLKTTQTMKTNIINHTVQTITSLEIAELTGKQHFHLMRDIRKMEIAWEKVTQSKFGCSTYKDATGRTLPCYVGAILRWHPEPSFSLTVELVKYLATCSPRPSVSTSPRSSTTRRASSWCCATWASSDVSTSPRGICPRGISCWYRR